MDHPVGGIRDSEKSSFKISVCPKVKTVVISIRLTINNFSTCFFITLKFNEYSALRNKLQEEGYSINEFVKQITGEFLNEDDQTLDTKKPGIYFRIYFPLLFSNKNTIKFKIIHRWSIQKHQISWE